MKTIKEILNLCKKFSFNDQYVIERVVELNHIGDCSNIIFSKSNIDENLLLRASGIVDDISLMIKDGNIGSILPEKKFGKWLFAAIVLRKII